MGRATRLHPAFIEILEAVVEQSNAEGIRVSITSGYRSLAAQRRLHKQDPERAAAPGQSFHNFGLAVDVAVSPPDALDRVGEIAEEHGLRWGGRFERLREPWHIDMGSLIGLQQARDTVRPRDLERVEIV